MTGRAIVIAEDDPPSRLLLASFLEDRGFEVGVAADGLQALKLIREKAPDFVITDVNMPEMNELELIRRLRSHHGSSRIPVIMLSAHTTSSEMLAGYAEGADDYIAKPVDLAVLGAKIDVLLARGQDAGPPPGAGHVILFMHARGGVGTSTLIANLAHLLQAVTVTGVCVLDLNLAYGDVAHQLGVQPRLGLADLSMHPPEHLDDGVFAKFVSPAGPGVYVVVATDRPEHGELVSLPAVQTAIAHLRDQFQYLLVDAAPGYDEHLLAVLDVADLVCVVTAAGAAAASTAELLKQLDRIGVPGDRQLVILNQAGGEAKAGALGEVLGRPSGLTVGSSERLRLGTESRSPLAGTEPGAEELTTLRELAAGLAERISRTAAVPHRARKDTG